MDGRQTGFDIIISDPELARYTADFIFRTGSLDQLKQAEPITDSDNALPTR
jgi:hypothetical protein